MGRSWHFAAIVLLALMSPPPATAQDIPGLEACTAEKQMERRTGCLQSNDDFLQRTLSKLSRETQAKIAASDRDLAAAKAEIAALKSAMEKLTGELMRMKEKVEAATKK
jgi:hypothetical protein